MRRSLPVLAALAALAVAATDARAAELTDLPPALRGDAALRYGGELFSGPIVEAGERVGGARQQRHGLRLDLAFAPTNGVAVTVGAELAPSMRVGFTEDGVAMVYDPVTDGGTYAGGPALPEPPVASASGLVGLWLGVAVGPYGRWMKQPDPYSWRLDLAVRFPNGGGTFFEAGDDRRGVAPGGTAFRLAGAFATERDFAEPYVSASYQHEGRVTVDVGDPDRGVTAPETSLQAPSAFDVRFGAELIASEDREVGLRVAVDLYAFGGYRTPARVGSGVFLPSVLDASRTIAVTTSEHLLVGAGMGLVIHPVKSFGIRLAGDVAALTPHRIEHVYAAQYGAGTHVIGVRAALTGRWR